MCPTTVKAAPGTPVTVGIRPESFKATGGATLSLKVELVEHLGGETYAYARHDNGELITVATDNNRTLDTGDTFEARFDPEVLLVFTRDGARIR